MSYLDERRKHIEDGRPLPPKKKYTIPKKSSKRIQKEKEQGVQIVKIKPKGWFDAEKVDVKNDEFPQWEQPKSSVSVFEAPKWMQNEANDIVTPYKSFNPNTPMGRWFLSIRPRLTGVCQHCGGKTMAVDKEADSKFHWSICHLFEKSHFPSIKTHDENYLELCYYSPSCHKNMDDKTLPLTQLNCFDEVVRKFCILYPLMTREEKRRVPSFLLQYLEVEK